MSFYPPFDIYKGDTAIDTPCVKNRCFLLSHGSIKIFSIRNLKMDHTGEKVTLFAFADNFSVVNFENNRSDNSLLPPGTRVSILPNDEGNKQVILKLRADIAHLREW